MRSPDLDAVVVGSGPNGLAAAIVLAQQGLKVKVFEAANTVGGGMRSAELTLPGFVHDVCSAIQPLGKASPFFASLDLSAHGLRWAEPDVQVAHPLDGGRAGAALRSMDETARSLGTDSKRYAKIFGPLTDSYQALLHEFLGPLRPPRHPIAMARFGLQALRPAAGYAEARFDTEEARALFMGMAGHSMLRLTSAATASLGLMLGILAHAVGWPIPVGGSRSIADALAAELTSLGGEIVTGHRVSRLDELPASQCVMLDVTPRQVMEIARGRLPARYLARLGRYRYGPGVFKLDLALDGPVPWTSEVVRRAGTIHAGGGWREVVASESEVWAGRHPESPLVLVAQPSLFDATRAPEGKHTLWAYCHVPSSSDVDMSERIEKQIERFAPGFRDLIIGRSKMTALQMSRYNENYVGGDINGGVQDLRQLFTRPVARLDPYSTPVEGIYICSSSTPPGGGVHGMCGYWAARSALSKTFGRKIG